MFASYLKFKSFSCSARVGLNNTLSVELFKLSSEAKVIFNGCTIITTRVELETRPRTRVEHWIHILSRPLSAPFHCHLTWGLGRSSQSTRLWETTNITLEATTTNFTYTCASSWAPSKSGLKENKLQTISLCRLSKFRFNELAKSGDV